MELKHKGRLEKRYDSAGYDLFTDSDWFLEPGEVVKIPVRLWTEFPKNYVGIIHDRSGMGKQGVKVLGGVIDSDYRGEWVVMLINCGINNIEINAGSAVAQVIFYQLPEVELLVTDSFSETARGEKGFGSTN